MKSIREILSNNNCDKKEVVVMLALHYRSNPNLLIELTSVAIDHSGISNVMQKLRRARREPSLICMILR